jgi:Protein of unknown function (DUF1697)
VVFAGEIEDTEAFKDLIVSKTALGGPAQSHYQRHQQSPWRLMLHTIPCSASTRWYAPLAYWLPPILMMQQGGGFSRAKSTTPTRAVLMPGGAGPSMRTWQPMSQYVALLRGINVGGKNLIARSQEWGTL